MAAQEIHARAGVRRERRYTLLLSNGELLRHQDSLVVAQFRADARLLRVDPEFPAEEPFAGYA